MSAPDMQQTIHIIQETNVWATISYIVGAVVGVAGIIFAAIRLFRKNK